MRSFQEKRRWRKIMESWPVLLLLTILLVIFSWSVIGFLRKMNLTKENREIAEEQLAQLKNKKQKLSNDIENLNTEEGKETIFRENFGLAKEGENLIIVLDEKNKEEEKISSKSGFFSKLLFWRD